VREVDVLHVGHLLDLVDGLEDDPPSVLGCRRAVRLRVGLHQAAHRGRRAAGGLGDCQLAGLPNRLRTAAAWEGESRGRVKGEVGKAWTGYPV
jgi:hypothetical protein